MDITVVTSNASKPRCTASAPTASATSTDRLMKSAAPCRAVACLIGTASSNNSRGERSFSRSMIAVAPPSSTSSTARNSSPFTIRRSVIATNRSLSRSILTLHSSHFILHPSPFILHPSSLPCLSRIQQDRHGQRHAAVDGAIGIAVHVQDVHVQQRQLAVVLADPFAIGVVE